jgi:hypothetical protein
MQELVDKAISLLFAPTSLAAIYHLFIDSEDTTTETIHANNLFEAYTFLLTALNTLISQGQIQVNLRADPFYDDYQDHG